MARRPRRSYHRKRGNNGRPSDAIVYKGIGMPDRFYTRLRYQEIASVSCPSGTLGMTQFRGNSLYDPNFTGGGNQPSYFDQICSSTALYNQYLVYGSKIEVRYSNVADTFATGNLDVALVPSQTAFGSTGWVNIDDMDSSKMVKRQSLSHYNGSVKRLHHYATTSKIFDVKNIRDNLGSFAGTSTSNPTAFWYWVIAAQPMDRTTTTSVNILVRITYYAMFFNLTDRPLS